MQLSDSPTGALFFVGHCESLPGFKTQPLLLQGPLGKEDQKLLSHFLALEPVLLERFKDGAEKFPVLTLEHLCPP